MSAEETNAIVAALRCGKTRRSIAAYFQRSEKTVRAIAKQNGIVWQPGPTRVTEQERDFIVAELRTGKTFVEVALASGRDKNTVARIAKKYGINALSQHSLGPDRPWDDLSDQVLERFVLVRRWNAATCAEMLGRSEANVRTRMRELGLGRRDAV